MKNKLCRKLWYCLITEKRERGRGRGNKEERKMNEKEGRSKTQIGKEGGSSHKLRK